MLQGAMARICSATDSQPAGGSQILDLTAPEHSAVKAESKRLRRAAQNGFFVMFGSGTLLESVVQRVAGSVRSGFTHSAEEVSAGPAPSSGRPSPYAARELSGTDAHNTHVSTVDTGLMTKDGVPHHAACHTPTQTMRSHIPAHCNRGQDPEELDTLSRVAHAHACCSQAHAPMMAHADGLASRCSGLVSSEHAIEAGQGKFSDGDVDRLLQRHTPEVGNIVHSGHGVAGELALEGQPTQVRNDVAQVRPHHSNVDGYTLLRRQVLKTDDWSSTVGKTSLLLQVTTACKPMRNLTGKIIASGGGSITGSAATNPIAQRNVFDHYCQHNHILGSSEGRDRHLQHVRSQELISRRWTMQDVPDRRHASESGENLHRHLTVSGETWMTAHADTLDSCRLAGPQQAAMPMPVER